MFRFNYKALRILCISACAAVWGLSLAVGHAGAQDTPPEETDSWLVGLELILTNNGFGLGGYYRDSVSVKYAFISEARIGAAKDPREIAFFDNFGRKSIPGKANYLLEVPIRIGFQRRIFSNKIEDNFRPFFELDAGPTLGWKYPYFDDCNGNQIFELEFDCNGDGGIDPDEGERRFDSFVALPKGDFQIGVGGAIGVGAHFGYSRRGVRGFRIAYSGDWYFKGVQLLEANIRGPQRYFFSPTITLFLGSIF